MSDVSMRHRRSKGDYLFPPATRVSHYFSSMSRSASSLAPLTGVLKAPTYYMHVHHFYSPFPMMTTQLNAYLSVCAIGTYLNDLVHKAQYEDITVGEIQQYVREAYHSIRHYTSHAEHQLLVGLSMPSTPVDISNGIRQQHLSPYHTAL